MAVMETKTIEEVETLEDTGLIEDIEKWLRDQDKVKPASDVDEEEELGPRRVLVEVYLPHVKKYGRDPHMALVYRWRKGPLHVGDLVLCPPTPRHRFSFTGIVISLDASQHPYKGPVKDIIKRIPRP